MKIKMNAHEKKILGKMNIYTEGKVVTNPFSKIEVELSAEALSVYDVIRGAEQLMVRLVAGENIPFITMEKTEEIFYLARDVFIRNWPEHYSTLID